MIIILAVIITITFVVKFLLRISSTKSPTSWADKNGLNECRPKSGRLLDKLSPKLSHEVPGHLSSNW